MIAAQLLSGRTLCFKHHEQKRSASLHLKGRKQAIARQQRASQTCHASQSGGQPADNYDVLGIPRSSSKADIRAAYIAKIKVRHPDISTDEDATGDAITLNAAYTALMESHANYDEADDLLDVFDITEAEPDLLFINPFGCQVDPLCWRELQDYAQRAPADTLLEDHLSAAGMSISNATSAVTWLTPAQLLKIEQELSRMEETMSFETTAWWLSDVLARARVTNNRLARSGANRW